MATWKSANSMLTAKGVEILNKIKAGIGSITVTRVVAGSGRVDESQLYTQTKVKGTEKVFTLSGTQFTTYDSESGEVTGSELSVILMNTGFTESYDLHQIGVYVTHPDYVGEVLYHISQCDADDFDTIPPVADTPVTFGYSLFLEHGNSSSINLTVDPQGVLSSEVFNKFVEKISEGMLTIPDSNGNLIPSGKVVKISNKGAMKVTDAYEHRALSLSIGGNTTQATTPTPLSPVSTFLNTKVQGVHACKTNLLDLESTLIKNEGAEFSTITVGASLNSLTVNFKGSVIPYVGYLIPVEVGKKYNISYYTKTNTTYFYKWLDAPIDSIDSSNYGTNLTSSGKSYVAEKPILLFGCFAKATTTTSFGMDYPMIVEGDVEVPFEVFKGRTVELPAVIELDGIGEYRDTIEWDGSKWWKVVRTATITLDGSTNKVVVESAKMTDTYTRGYKNNALPNPLANSPAISSHGNSVDIDNLTASFYCFGHSNGTGIGVHILNTVAGIQSTDTQNTARATKINNWLIAQKNAGTPVIVKYVLAVPIVTEISTTEVLEMFKDLTDIRVLSSGNVPHMRLGYAIDTTDPTIMYILKSLARKSDVQTANTFAIAELSDEE